MTHTLRPTRRLAGILLVAVLPLAAACGASTPGAGPAATLSSSAAPTTSSPTSSPTSATATAAADDYCTALKEGTAALEKISGAISDPAAAVEGVAVLQKIEAAAPAEVKQSWTDLITFIEAVAAGDTTAVASSAQKMTTSMTSIEQHAKTECGITLS